MSDHACMRTIAASEVVAIAEQVLARMPEALEYLPAAADVVGLYR